VVESPELDGATHHALPDKRDDRDKPFVAKPRQVPPEVPLAQFEECRLPVMDQGDEHACAGFGLAAVVHYLMRRRSPHHVHVSVSARMLYEMAKRHDEWPGVQYPGSSARGALKGWHKHGVCAANLWPYIPDQIDRDLTESRRRDAATRPLLTYERVDKADLGAMRAAVVSAGIVYVSARVHMGWRKVGRNGRIPRSGEMLGTHAFAIVGYDRAGFWLQNSKGTGWGARGFGHLAEGDWAENAQDAWVARLGPISRAT
jgi:hypothetical protein